MNTKPHAKSPKSDAAALRDKPEGGYPVNKSMSFKVADGFAGSVLLMEVAPNGIPPHGWTGTWYKRIIYAYTGAGAVAFTPTGNVFIVDFKEGFKPTRRNLHAYAHQYEQNRKGEGHPQPGDTPVVT